MKHYDLIVPEALKTNGVFTFRTAKRLGIQVQELSRWVKMGRIVRVGHGVYRLSVYPFHGIVEDRTALLAEVGEGAFLWGASAIDFLGLCPVPSYVAYVATPRRVRKRFSNKVVIKHARRGYKPFYHSGVACQQVEDAIRSSIGVIAGDLLQIAVKTAEKWEYLSSAEALELKEDVANGVASRKRRRRASAKAPAT